MDDKSAPLSVGQIWRRVVKRLTVVDKRTACWQFHGHGFRWVHRLFHVEQQVGFGGFIVGHRHSMRSGHKMHGPVVYVRIVERHPATDEVGGLTLPVGVVLMPEHRAAVMRGFEQRLIVKKLDIGAEQRFYQIENGFVVQQGTEMDVAFAHLHDLEHLDRGGVAFDDILCFVSGQIAVMAGEVCLIELVVVFAAERFDPIVIEKFADLDKSSFVKFGHLFEREARGPDRFRAHPLVSPGFVHLRVFGLDSICKRGYFPLCQYVRAQTKQARLFSVHPSVERDLS